MTLDDVQVGDYVDFKYKSSLLGKMLVVKVTATQIHIQTSRIIQKFKKRDGRRVGGDKWDQFYISPIEKKGLTT